MTSVRVKGGYGGRIDVSSGQILEIVNVGGKQVCDFFAFSAHNVREQLSPTHTRSLLNKTFLEVGDRLYSVLRAPLFELLEDTVGVNDFCLAQCDPQRYRMDFGVAEHRSCRQNLAEAMTDFDIPNEYLPEPINFFQATPIEPDGRFGLATSPAKPGDKVVLRALSDVIAVASACPQDITPLNDRHLTDLDLVVHAG